MCVPSSVQSSERQALGHKDDKINCCSQHSILSVFNNTCTIILTCSPIYKMTHFTYVSISNKTSWNILILTVFLIHNVSDCLELHVYVHACFH